MADVVTEYIQASDNAADYADSLILGLEQKALEDIDDLYQSNANRDDELWEAYGVDTELTLDDYDEEETRGIDWALGLAGISAAAQSQFFLDNREETIIKPTAYREQVLGGFALTRAQLVSAGKRGFEVVGVAEFEVLRADTLSKFDFMYDLSNTELYERLLNYGAMRPAEQAIASAQGYVARMTNYRPGSPQFKEEVANLISTSSKRGLKSMNRRAVSRLHTLGQVGGDTKKLLVWIGEGGKHTCDYCFALFGDVDTYENWLSRGEPGADVCKGGDLCQCQLVAY
jgi:hypothetical protein